MTLVVCVSFFYAYYSRGFSEIKLLLIRPKVSKLNGERLAVEELCNSRITCSGTVGDFRY